MKMMIHATNRFSIHANSLLLAAAAAIGLAGCQSTMPYGPSAASLAIAEPDFRCPPGAEASDEALAAALGIDTELLGKLHALRGLSNNDVCTMPTKRLQRAIAKVNSPKPDHPGQWAAFRAMQQADEDGVVKPDGLIRGIEQRKAMVDAQLAEQQALGLPPPPAAGIYPTSGWKSIGPGNIGGRIRSILIHPTLTNKMWVGSVSGGIWFSNDSGASWNPVNDFMGNLAVSTMAIDPFDANVMYAGTGEGFFNGHAVRGAGIFKSTDGGVTWNQMDTTNPAGGAQWYYVNRLAMSPGAVGTMLAATNSGLYRTTDGGTTWAQVATGRTLDVRFDPMDATRAQLGRDNGQVARSTDSGVTWTTQTLAGAGRVELAYGRTGTPTVVYAVFNAHADPGCVGCSPVYRSTDGGVNWALRSDPKHLATQGWYDNVAWVDPTNSNHVIVGGIDLYRSTDGGATFAKLSQWFSAPMSPHADHHAIVSHPGYNGTTNRTIFFGNDGGLYKAQDINTVTLTTNWTMLNTGLGITQYYGGAGWRTAGTGRITGGTQDNGDLRYAGTGTNWTAWFGGDGGYSAVDKTNDNYIYGEYVFLSIHRSTNGGTTSANICAGITEGYGDANFGCSATATTEANFIAPFIIDPNNQSRMYAGAKSLWRTNNVNAAGQPTWVNVKPTAAPGGGNYVSAIAVAEFVPDIVWVGHNFGHIYKSVNGTSATPVWTAMGLGVLPSRMVLRFLIDRSNANIVYVSFGGYSAGNLWKSTNGGATWTDISAGLPQVPIRTIERHRSNPNWLYVGTEVGVFTSEDAGATWKATTDGPSNVPVDELFWYDDLTLVAATHGRGMFMTPVVPSVSNRKRDFNGDTRGDILWRLQTNGSIYIWLMDGTTLSTHGTPGAVTLDWQVVATGDYDGDGKADLFWRYVNGMTYVWLMNGLAINSSGSPGAVTDVNWQVQASGDFDGNGKSDILWRNVVTGDLYIWLMNGAAIGSHGSPGGLPLAWQVKAVGDFNGDGKADIVLSNTVTGEVAIWLMNGTAIGLGGSPGLVPLEWVVAGAGDLDGDGKADIVWRNNLNGYVAVWLMNGTAIGSSTIPGSVVLNWQIQGVADYAGVGKGSILWRDTVSGNLIMWQMDGLTIKSFGPAPGVSDLNWQIQDPK